MTTAVLCVPLRVEQAALRRATQPAARPAGPPAAPPPQDGHRLRLIRTGMGARRATAAAIALRPRSVPVMVAGVGGGLQPQARPGDIVVATEVRGGPIPVPVPSAPLLAAALRRLGLRVHLGPIVTAQRLLSGAARQGLSGTGALAVDMESAYLAAAATGAFAALRAIVDTPDAPLWSVTTPARGVVALRALRRTVPALRQWAAATGPRDVLLAAARSVATRSDLVLVVGGSGASDTRLLVEIVERVGVPTHVVHEVGDVDLRWLAGAARIGVTVGGAAPPDLARELVYCLSGLGPVALREREVS
jgi:4-hydroxy-3-methylbut-2-enyl diphosphate reductase